MNRRYHFPMRLPRRTVLLFLGIVLAAVVVYARALPNQFVDWDDTALITTNPLVGEFSARTIWGAFTSYDPELYIPLTIVSFSAEHTLFGFQPFFFHLTNLVLHIVISWLVFLFLRKMGNGEAVAYLCALLFAVHPLNVEAVAWASARKDLLMAVFALASLLSFVRWKEEGSKKWYWWTFTFLLLSLLSKPTAIAIPFAYLLLEWLGMRKFRWNLLKEHAPFLGLSVLFLIIGLLGKTRNIESLTLLQTILLSAKSTVLTSFLFFYPRFSLLFLQATPITIRSLEFLLPLSLLLAAAVAVLWTLRKTRVVAFGVIFALLFLLPSFANFAKTGNVYVTSDRYFYLSQIGFLFLMGLFLERQWAKRGMVRNVMLALFVVILAGAAWSSSVRSLYWKDSETLFTKALARNPQSAECHNNLGYVYDTRGEPDKAIAEYQQALTLKPTFAQAYYNMGVVLQKQGKIDDALFQYRKALEINPLYAQPHNNLGAVAMDRGDLDLAISEFKKAIELSPRLAHVYINLGAAYGKKGAYDLGMQAYRKAMDIDPVFRREIVKKFPELKNYR